MITRDELAPMLAAGEYAALIAGAMEALVETAPEYPPTKQGTVASWFRAHDGQTLQTLMIDARNVWYPGPRTCTSAASYAHFNGSAIEYRPSRVVAADASTLVFVRPWGDTDKLFAYWIA